MRYDLPVIVTTVAWWSTRSRIAFATTGSMKIDSQSPKLTFVVIMVLFFSYRISISWKKRLESSLLIGRYPSSSIISNLYLQKCFKRVSNRFSSFALFNCCSNSWHLIKYVLVRFFAAAIPTAVARWVFPHATRTQEYDVFLPLKKAKGHKILNLLWVDTWLEVEFKVLQSLLKGECTCFYHRSWCICLFKINFIITEF